MMVAVFFHRTQMTSYKMVFSLFILMILMVTMMLMMMLGFEFGNFLLRV